MAVVEGSGSGGTTTFNEVNAANDFNNVIEHAREVKEILARGSQEIEENIANRNENDAYSGSAAQEILNQWEDLAATFDEFLNNFKTWHEEGVTNAKEYLKLQEETRRVNVDQTQ